MGRLGIAVIECTRLLKSVRATAKAISRISSSPIPARASASRAATAPAGPVRDWLRPKAIAAIVRGGRSARARSCSMRSMRPRLIPCAQSIARTAA